MVCSSRTTFVCPIETRIPHIGPRFNMVAISASSHGSVNSCQKTVDKECGLQALSPLYLGFAFIDILAAAFSDSTLSISGW